MKSDVDIAKLIYHAIQGSGLEKAVKTDGGKLCDRGRPQGSDREDIVISVLANEGCGQIQRAFVNVNVYVRDQYHGEDKAYERHTERIGTLCKECEFLFSLHGEGWHTVSKDCEQRVYPAGVEFRDGHTEHFINNKLYIEINNE